MSASNDNKPIMWYIADPMCSWCWGFSPVIEALKSQYENGIKFALVLGGLRPYTQEPITEDLRREILHHWHEVQKMTGQEFNFEGALANGFIYDTEPASRAVIVAGELYQSCTFAYFKAVQRAFYVEHKDVTTESVLWELLQALAVDSATLTKEEFMRRFDSQHARQKTQAHFYQSRQWGVRGFPTLILQDERQYYLLTSGYRAQADLKQEVDTWLKTAKHLHTERDLKQT